MRRTIWLSSICLVGILGLVNVKTFAPSVLKRQVKVAESYEQDHELPLAIKGDRLPDDELQPSKVAVQTVKIFPVAAAPEEVSEESSKKEWRPAYARMRASRHSSGRHHRRPRSRR